MSTLEWHEGPPPKPWSEEWFIALTTFGDRVVLKALPEEWTYDFKTADETHFRADKIAKWMQFPDSDFIAPVKDTVTETDPINNPAHYTSSSAKCECGRQIECIQVVEHMGFCLGNTVKYIWRADLKNDAIEDLKKAHWYLDREISKREAVL